MSTLINQPCSPEKLPTTYVTFRAGQLYFGVDVDKVQEVLRYQPMTPVPLAPSMVKGLVNLRGQIITAIDLREMLKLEPSPNQGKPMKVVIRTSNEVVSLLVDSIGDVIEVSSEDFEQIPETVSSHLKSLLRGVFKLQDELMLVLDATTLLDSKKSFN